MSGRWEGKVNGWPPSPEQVRPDSSLFANPWPLPIIEVRSRCARRDAYFPKCMGYAIICRATATLQQEEAKATGFGSGNPRRGLAQDATKDPIATLSCMHNTGLCRMQALSQATASWSEMAGNWCRVSAFV